MTDDHDPMGLIVPPRDAEALRSLAEAQLAAAKMQPLIAVEVGTWAGGTARMLADLCVPHPPAEPAWPFTAPFHYRVFCVDHWLGNPCDSLAPLALQYGQKRAYETWCRNMGPRLYRSVFPLIGTSLQHAAVWPRDLPIDLLFLDADHTYEHVRQDIAAWSPLVRPGGIISGHDFHPNFPGVVAAVEQTGPYIVCAGSTIWWRTARDPKQFPNSNGKDE
ncbi:MAG TPA: class I SAM-dependent methyltransferase [Phycisphaerae bacterium]|nr:class I SAM-dependent methyltransferase [Phycisphaerae bacterium]